MLGQCVWCRRAPATEETLYCVSCLARRRPTPPATARRPAPRPPQRTARTTQALRHRLACCQQWHVITTIPFPCPVCHTLYFGASAVASPRMALTATALIEECYA
jgi:hypothetical protein